MVWNSFTLWNVNFLIIEICFLNISFSPLLMSCIRLSRLAISVVVFCFKPNLSILHRQFNEFNRLFFDNLPKIQFFGTKLRQIWFQVYASTSKFMPLTRTTFASHFYLGDENFKFQRNQLVFYRPKRRQVN